MGGRTRPLALTMAHQLDCEGRGCTGKSAPKLENEAVSRRMARSSDRCGDGVGVDGAAAARRNTNTAKLSARTHVNGDNVRARLRGICNRRHVEKKAREAGGDVPWTIITPQPHSSPMRVSIPRTAPYPFSMSQPESSCEDPRGVCDGRVGRRPMANMLQEGGGSRKAASTGRR